MNKPSALTVKLILIGIIVILLLIGNTMIKSKLEDREYAYNSALRSISESAGGKFKSGGPVIVLPYEQTVYTKLPNGEEKKEVNRLHKFISPESLSYKANLETEKRTVGIYSAPVFSGDLTVKAEFEIEDLSSQKYKLDEAFLLFTISDRSLQSKPVFKINGKSHEVYLTSVTGFSGIASDIKLEKGKISFESDIKIRGALSFSTGVDATDTSLSVTSDWVSPGFTGYDMLPDRHEITEKGFQAEWSIPFADKNAGHSIGFDFIDPVNVYKKLDRAVTYGFLFIIVPFIVLFLFEAFARINLHPLQYLLSGAACVLFFLLLLAMSEHISFGLSYILASLAAGLSTSSYIASISKKKRFGFVMSGVFIVLYAYLYLSLKSEDYALLIGSLFAFIVVTLLMFFTRNGILFHHGEDGISEEVQPVQSDHSDC